ASPSSAPSSPRRPRLARRTRPAWPSGSGRTWTISGRTGAWTGAGSRDGVPISATPRTRVGRRPSRARSTGCRTAQCALRTASPRHRAVPVQQRLLPRGLWTFDALDEDAIGAGCELEGIARPDHDVGILADVERPDAVGDTPELRGRQGHRPQRGVAIHAVRNRVARVLAEVAG